MTTISMPQRPQVQSAIETWNGGNNSDIRDEFSIAKRTMFVWTKTYITFDTAGTVRFVKLNLGQRILRYFGYYQETILDKKILKLMLQWLQKSDSPELYIWNKKEIAQKLWKKDSIRISDEMVKKVNRAEAYLKRNGFALGGVDSDGNCFMHAFFESYKGLTHKIPLLDTSSDPIRFLREQIAAQYRNSPKHSKYPNRADAITQDKDWVIALGEGSLLARALSIPIRVLSVEVEGVSDMVAFSENKEDQEWSTIDAADKPHNHIFVVDLGGHFVYAAPVNKGL